MAEPLKSVKSKTDIGVKNTTSYVATDTTDSVPGKFTIELPPTPIITTNMNIRTTAKTVAITALLSAVSTAHLAQANISVSDEPSGQFSSGSLASWEERSFKGNTHYELVQDNGVQVLKGQTRGQASVLYKERSIDLDKTPIVNWSWKIDKTYDGIDERTRGGDDYPARLYVVAKVGFLPWETLAINYVWASNTEIGESWKNPFTDKAIMVVVDSGDMNAGKWTMHSRNVAQDFKNLFGKNIDEINGYAVMVDGDNSGQEATSWFGEISFTES